MDFDIIVIGGGHAGIEAAYIAAKKKLSTLLITGHLDLIGQMSCNPSIGGIAKGNIVREIDALGGIMAQAIDRTGIHFKMLNKSKGMAVWGPRAQADKLQYRKFMRQELEEKENLFILQSTVERIEVKAEKVTAIVLNNGERIGTRAVICAMGTFLNGVGHIGLNSFPCGRSGEPPTQKLTESLNGFGIKSGRLKTGTSPRIDGRTIDFSKMEEQKGDTQPWQFSFSKQYNVKNKVSCWITKTNTRTHDIIKNNLDRSPLYTGKIKSIGPRYCPSIEDKVVRFGERECHTLFLEPEGIDTHEIYCSGLSTSLPFDVQILLVQSVAGMEQARILRPGYGIEYDYFPPVQLYPTLESKIIKNLFFAGQINGTSGYEEAACQGLVAAANASEALLGEQPMVLGRETSYIGVLIDDLVTRGTEEPYRMFTSRAEYRLSLRQDNADQRLMPVAFEHNLIEKETFENRQRFWEEKKNLRARLEKMTITQQIWNDKNRPAELKSSVKADELLKRPEVSIEDIEEMTGSKVEEKELKKSVEADIKYSGFIEKQKTEIDHLKKMENIIIPQTFDFNQVNGLLTESRIKLQKIKPCTVGQASRIPGVTPADVLILIMHIIKNK